MQVDCIFLNPLFSYMYMCVHMLSIIICMYMKLPIMFCHVDREVSFVLRLNTPDGSDCRPPSFLDRGIRFEIGNSSGSWWPIRFYTSTTSTTSSSLVTLLPNNHVRAVAKNYASDFPLYANSNTGPFTVTEYFCGGVHFTSDTVFRWLQRYRGVARNNWDTWSLSNVSISYWNNHEWCTVPVQQSDFAVVGNSSTAMCEDENRGNNAIFINEATTAPDGIPRRRVIMRPNWNAATCSNRTVSGTYIYLHVSPCTRVLIDLCMIAFSCIYMCMYSLPCWIRVLCR